MTASSTSPPERTACTTESGASEIAATCSTQAPEPTPMPIANQRWLHSEAARAQRVADVDRAARRSAAVLVEEREVRCERAEQREQDAEMEGQEIRP